MSIAALVDEIARLRAENAELRLALAAQQGKPDGAPSSRWVWMGDWWQVGPNTNVVARAFLSGALWRPDVRMIGGLLTEHGTVRAAMLFADNLQRNTP